VEVLRSVVAVVIIAAYVAAMIVGVHDRSYRMPDGLAFGVWLCVSFLLYGPAAKKMKGINITLKPPPEPEQPDKPSLRKEQPDES
jgi:hypothetical protein